MRRRRPHLGTAVRLTAFLGLILATVLGLALTGLLRAFSSQSDASTTRSLVAEVRALGLAASQRPTGQSLAAFTDDYLRTPRCSRTARRWSSCCPTARSSAARVPTHCCTVSS